MNRAKKRVTKLGMGSKRALVGSVAPPPVSCPAPRVPQFDAAAALNVVMPSAPPSLEGVVKPASGIRRRPLVDDRVEPVAPGAQTPHLAEGGPELTSVSIEPRGAFLLTRIDGQLTVDDLADMLGMEQRDVLAHLERLESLGLVTFR
jgi:hypothetical protein